MTIEDLRQWIMVCEKSGAEIPEQIYLFDAYAKLLEANILALHAKLEKAVEDAANYEMDKHKAEAKLAESEEKVRIASKLLKAREWIEPNLGEGSEYNICLECGRDDFEGHKSDCEFSVALARLDSGGKEKA